MSDNITLFCLVEGDSKEKFIIVVAEKNDYVNDLKKKIKEEKPNLFANIDANDIVLWKVNIPIEEDTMEVDTIPGSTQDKVKLSIPSKKIRNVFTENIADDSINIIIERPSEGQGHTSDLLAKIEELKSGQEELKSNMESGLMKIHNAMDLSLCSSGFKTETEKGKEVLEKGRQIDFPLKVTTITKSGGPGRFMSPLTNEVPANKFLCGQISYCGNDGGLEMCYEGNSAENVWRGNDGNDGVIQMMEMMESHK
ncbi:hypothetical protein Glove_139g400 [Diversispora epigaea]|uniref:Crinkler effector protein N-terminal domain-containing protein n=1 Tax=Diversispora epigaea TaxID=1348612 RepID=A0A397J4B5_9GLOM|nr:hypothetical protein Glove_139g400 [Diversispora epigaea]